MIEAIDIKNIQSQSKDIKDSTLPAMLDQIENDMKLLRNLEAKEFLVNSERLKDDDFNKLLAELGERKDMFLASFMVGLQRVQAMIKAQERFRDELIREL